MAFTCTPKTQVVKMVTGVQNVDSSGNVEDKGIIVMGSIDITEYNDTNSIPAGFFHMRRIYDVILQSKELTKTIAVNAVPDSTGATVSVTAYDTDSTCTQVTDAANGGEFSFIAAGEALGAEDNT